VTHEIRKNDDATVDEVIACHPRFFHLEQMADDHWWMAVNTDVDQEIHINLSAKSPIKALVEVQPESPPSRVAPHHCVLCSKTAGRKATIFTYDEIPPHLQNDVRGLWDDEDANNNDFLGWQEENQKKYPELAHWIQEQHPVGEILINFSW